MLLSEELRAWATSAERQAETKAGVDAFAIEWSSSPINRWIAASMPEPGTATADAHAAALRDLMEDPRWVDALLARVADEMRRDPFFDPPFRTFRTEIQSGIILYHDDWTSISIGVTDLAALAAKKSAHRTRASITFTGSISVLKAVKAGGAQLSFWEAPPITSAFTAAAAGRCWKTGEKQLEDGDAVLVDGRFQSYVIERASADMVLMQAAVKTGQAPLKVEYDAFGQEYVASSAADDADSRVQMLATFLRKMDAPGAVATLAPLLDTTEFFVRWHVMKEMLGIDAASAFPYLARMAADDPHPDVRRAAAAVHASLIAANPALQDLAACPA
jgi:hypothetical protein